MATVTCSDAENASAEQKSLRYSIPISGKSIDLSYLLSDTDTHTDRHPHMCKWVTHGVSYSQAYRKSVMDLNCKPHFLAPWNDGEISSRCVNIQAQSFYSSPDYACLYDDTINEESGLTDLVVLSLSPNVSV